MSGDTIRQGLSNLAVQAGIRPVEDGDEIPGVRCDLDLRQTAISLGLHCARLDIVRYADGLYFFNDDGDPEIMTPAIFRTWIAEFVVLFNRQEKYENPKTGLEEMRPKPYTLRMDDCGSILKSPVFKQSIKKVSAINNVRLPIRRPTGEVELLPLGYDVDSQIWTRKDALEYDENFPLDDVHGWFYKYFGAFPFAEDRSKGVQVAAMLSVFIKHLLPEESLRPGFLFYANKPGSGKSVLAKASLYPTLGSAAAAKMQDGENFDKMLEAFSIHGVPYIFLDNIYGSIRSAALDQMLTSTESIGRAMGGHGIFLAKNNAQILITGNNIDLNEDAQRRFLIVDLFEQGNPRDRVVENPLSDYVMKSEIYRKEALAALWAIVRSWAEAGCPEGDEVLPTFESFSRTMGGIVKNAGFENPMIRAEMLDSVNPENDEFITLLVHISKQMEEEGLETKNWTAQDFARLARSHGLMEEKIGTEEEGRRLTVKMDKIPNDLAGQAMDYGYLDAKSGSVFGKFLAKQVGSVFQLGDCSIEFGARKERRKKSYTLIRKCKDMDQPF